MKTGLIKPILRRVRLDRSGYDRSGSYWGQGKPLYYFAYLDPFNNLEHSDHIRAADRAEAKAIIRAKWPNRVFKFHN